MVCVVVVVGKASFQGVSFTVAEGGVLEFGVFWTVSGDFECKGAFGGVSKLSDGAVKWLEYGGAFLGNSGVRGSSFGFSETGAEVVMELVGEVVVSWLWWFEVRLR